MITKIGIVSGEIWHYLEQHKACSLTELARGLDKDRNIVLMSFGWLSREGHVILEDQENDYKITLRF